MAVDQLKSVIISLTDDEKEEFRVFTQRQRSKDKRRDLELFEIIAEYPEKKPKDIIHELLNTNMDFKLSEFIFMEILSSKGEHTNFFLK